MYPFSVGTHPSTSRRSQQTSLKQANRQKVDEAPSERASVASDSTLGKTESSQLYHTADSASGFRAPKRKCSSRRDRHRSARWSNRSGRLEPPKVWHGICGPFQAGWEDSKGLLDQDCCCQTDREGKQGLGQEEIWSALYREPELLVP